MTAVSFDVRRGTYYDSVVLMQLQRGLLELPGVQDAGVVMATSANCELLAQSELLPDGIGKVGVEDLLIVVRAESEKEAESALASVDDLLSRRRSVSAGKFQPHSLEGAAEMLPEAEIVLISVPGRYAAEVAREALNLNRHVFLYSDNITLEDEIELKEISGEVGLLVMGPDCGTAIVNGIGLGFANRVRRGGIGLVGASGTGLQAVTSRIHALGGGVSHALGTGGRDLKSEVGGVTAKQALDLLSRDSATEVIVLVSKPPDPEVAASLLNAAQGLSNPVVVHFMGYAAPARSFGNLTFADNFNDAAFVAVDLLKQVSTEDVTVQSGTGPSDTPGYLRGLFSGGSLASEALRGLQVALTPMYSNIVAPGSRKLPDSTKSQAHTILDLGEDEFTVGRLHPMMDNDLRIRMMRQEGDDQEVAVILMDVVLGEGAHPDPAADLAPAIKELRKARDVEIVVILVGTEDDPQDIEVQRRRMIDAGAVVLEDTMDAVSHVISRLDIAPKETIQPVSLKLLETPLAAINVGLESFYESLIDQEAQAVHVDWRPPAGGDEKLMSILKKMRS